MCGVPVSGYSGEPYAWLPRGVPRAIRYPIIAMTVCRLPRRVRRFVCGADIIPSLTSPCQHVHSVFADFDDRSILVLENPVLPLFFGEKGGELLHPTQTTGTLEPRILPVDEMRTSVFQTGCRIVICQVLDSLYDRSRVRQLSITVEAMGCDDDSRVSRHWNSSFASGLLQIEGLP